MPEKLRFQARNLRLAHKNRLAGMFDDSMLPWSAEKPSLFTERAFLRSMGAFYLM